MLCQKKGMEDFFTCMPSITWYSWSDKMHEIKYFYMKSSNTSRPKSKENYVSEK
jgi:hypothetical protein